MQLVKIQIADPAGRAKALVEMARRGRVICLPEDTFVVPKAALALLQTLGVPYQELAVTQGGGAWRNDPHLRHESAAPANT